MITNLFFYSSLCLPILIEIYACYELGTLYHGNEEASQYYYNFILAHVLFLPIIILGMEVLGNNLKINGSNTSSSNVLWFFSILLFISAAVLFISNLVISIYKKHLSHTIMNMYLGFMMFDLLAGAWALVVCWDLVKGACTPDCIDDEMERLA